MITKEMKDKDISCKGKGFNCRNCKDAGKCAEYKMTKDQVKSFLELGKIYYVETYDRVMYAGVLYNKKENFFELISSTANIGTAVAYASVKCIKTMSDPMEFKIPNINLSDKNDEVPKEKPPIGIMPKKIWDLQRMNNLKLAIERYFNADMEIPFGWVDEYNSLLRLYKEEI